MGDGKSLDQGSSEKEIISEDYLCLPTGEFQCNFCPGKFKRIGNMRNHLSAKHNRVHQLICECGKEFTETSRLSHHREIVIYHNMFYVYIMSNTEYYDYDVHLIAG